MSQHTVFAYGTLTIPEVMTALTGDSFRSRHATVEGYQRRRMAGLTYPGLTPVDGGFTDGRVYFGVTEEAYQLLDRFEDAVYQRVELQVTLDNGEHVYAGAWIVGKEDVTALSDEPWELEPFWREHAEEYLAMCRRVARGEQAAQDQP